MHNRFKVPAWVSESNFSYTDWRSIPMKKLVHMRKGLARFQHERPVVSIVIPVWNEAKNILRTLSSFAAMEVPFPCELIFVNNNSTDDTQYILDLLEVKTIFQPKQGIAHARLAGLQASRGTYQLCGDGDSLYPPKWISEMTIPLMASEKVTCVYGNYSFIPAGNTSRITLGLYEILAETLFEFRRLKREFLNVRGANFGFRVQQGLAVKGFEMTITRVYDNDESSGSYVVFGEDGRMGRKLGEIGKLQLVRHSKARIWTSSRRLLKDGSLAKAFRKRIKAEFFKLKEYGFGAPVVNQPNDVRHVS